MPNYFETTATPVQAAAFHYFRLPPEKWELLLTRLQQMGCQTIVAPVVWGFHQFEPDTVDLTGATNPRRNLAGLLQTCAALNLTCILNPGPYCHAGVLGNGLPLWLLKQSERLETALPPAVSAWFKALSHTLAGQQWPNGPLIALQLEVEAGQLQPTDLSPQLSEIKWRIWLRKHYEGIEALNAAYGAAYRTVNEVKFPASWSAEPTPLEQDAQAFLAEVQQETKLSYWQIWLEAGWQIPIDSGEANSSLPPWRWLNLSADPQPPTPSDPPAILYLPHPLQADPDPVDIGRGPLWAANAPIHADGSLRPSFWQGRRQFWLSSLPAARLDEQTLIAAWPGGAVITRSSDAALKVSLTASSKAAIYRLYFTGELIPEPALKAGRGKLVGPYRANDESGPTDLYLVVNNPTAPLSDFALTYLSRLLAAQAHTLERCARSAVALSQGLSGSDQPSPPPEKKGPAPRAHLLDEARRGLREADAALRKAATSIGELESGISTILGKDLSQPAGPAFPINLGSFDLPARNLLAEVGETCAAVSPTLQAAAAGLQACRTHPGGFTVEQYRQSYAATLSAAQITREALLEVIALLRLELAAQRLPLVGWRVHDQVQALAESLRWGVLRG